MTTSFPCVHHIEMGVVDGPGTVSTLTSRFNFRVSCTRETKTTRQWVLEQGDTRVMVTCWKQKGPSDVTKDPYLTDWMAAHPLHAQNTERKDSVFNIAFQVRDMNACVKTFQANGTVLSKPLRTVSDTEGSVKVCTVKSCVGDVYHTLIEKDGYSGLFLPGFEPPSPHLHPMVEEGRHQDSTSYWSNFDHVALAVEMNSSRDVIAWYENNFGMKRFLINEEEDAGDGLVLSTANVGLRLRAMEYWKCAEVGLISKANVGQADRMSMVIAEGLPALPGVTEENQIEAWLRQHGGPGVQHIALNTKDIKATVGRLKLKGVAFANPPPANYYAMEGRLDDIQRAGEDVDSLSQHGILIDTEADRQLTGIDGVEKPLSKRETYLLQIFTKPLLLKDPFFLEFIQREGATGFGSGNVQALYRSVQASILGQEKCTAAVSNAIPSAASDADAAVSNAIPSAASDAAAAVATN